VGLVGDGQGGGIERGKGSWGFDFDERC